MRSKYILIIVLCMACYGCEQAAKEKKFSTVSAPQKAAMLKEAVETTAKEEEKELAGFKPFYIYGNKGSRDNHYIPSGFMGSVSCIQFNDRWQEGCQSGKTCIKIDFDMECARDDKEWGGIYWQNPANNWGNRKGGYNLTGAKKLTFWAKGEEGGEQIEELTIGGITGDYPDSDKAVIGPIILSSEWRQYTFDLSGKDLSYINGAFAWATNQEVNGEHCNFYLDEIRFE